MFDVSLPSAEALQRADGATVLAAIATWAQIEAAAAARRPVPKTPLPELL